MLIAFVITWLGLAACAACDEPDEPRVVSSAEGIEWFEKRVRPVLAQHCYECHGPDQQESDLRLDRLPELAQGGKSGPVVVPGKVESSLLATAISYGDTELRMPPDGKLGDQQIADLRRWIAMGAPHPDARDEDAASWWRRETAQSHSQALVASERHWAFQPPVKPTPPRVNSAAWPQGEVDRFILDALERSGLRPAKPADRRTLIRRATFDLTGLPPTEQEIEQFVGDRSPEAFARVVERLLASPHYGARWGRHWLDVARYADSNGLDENVAHGNAWRYRDYVIDAMNRDVPYDLFVRQQIAGDLMPAADPWQRNENLIATGFLSLGPKVLAEVDEKKMEMDIVDEQIDTIGKAMLGLTLGCARCHDHKFDPITMRDYYAMAGIFTSTHTMDSFTKIARWHEHQLYDPQYEQQKSDHEAKVATKRRELDAIVAEATAALGDPDRSLGAAEPTREELSKLEARFPDAMRKRLAEVREQIARMVREAPVAPSAMGVREGTVADAPIHPRGNHLTLGDVVPRGIPAVLAMAVASPGGEAFFSGSTSGRLALTDWLTSDHHPLTARVIVNRVWYWHFGRGLVESTDNFGLQGTPPEHPELLDWLAVTFIEDGWSLKKLHRRIMLSATYQMSSEFDVEAAAIDPQGAKHWRWNSRRLDAEQLRDALLAVSGQLDLTQGGPVLGTPNRAHIFDHTSKDDTQYDGQRRAVYLPVVRNHLHDSFTLFDATDATTSTGTRATSTVASQALYLMNSPFVADASQRLADRLIAVEGKDDSARVELLYRWTIGRPPRESEAATMIEHLARLADLVGRDVSDAAKARREAWRLVCQALLMSNEFLYVR